VRASSDKKRNHVALERGGGKKPAEEKNHPTRPRASRRRL
jgi:hypothetical protein